MSGRRAGVASLRDAARDGGYPPAAHRSSRRYRNLTRRLPCRRLPGALSDRDEIVYRGLDVASRGPSRAVVVHHRSAQTVREVVGRTVHQMAVEEQQVARIHRHRGRIAHVVVDDLDVAVVRLRAAVGYVLVHRLAVRARQHGQASVLARGRRYREPDTDDWTRRIEREVVAVLVPRLAP